MIDKRKLIIVAMATAIAAPAEGLRTLAYRDPAQGVPTICFGSTKGVRLGDTATPEQCRQLLTAEMLEAVDQVDRCVPGLPVQVAAAFADAAYNLGPTIVCDRTRSTAARLLAAGRLREACEQLLRWDRARVAGVLVALPGLTKRRAVERDLCLQGVAP
ncbi:glycoside hydrolase family protein [Curvibacter sp. HBC28]|uniref:Lysozyme n=1 Tax=Curvibacter microcysteis TaxID=3026419 RepID=A0ABT5MCK2_9BURK|nr:glycoside hydrolase family protein [Curvibacter sp. HBC28]MDD0814297.1 glycoside hydrolase family protein [Curvibacter sp. HBC28]